MLAVVLVRYATLSVYRISGFSERKTLALDFLSFYASDFIYFTLQLFENNTNILFRGYPKFEKTIIN